MKKGDRVIITKGPIDKIGKIGVITTLAVNGAIVRFPDGNGTAVQFKHLELYKGSK